jgi:hypothetical protein
MELIFTKRKNEDKYQARFWTNKVLWEQFFARVKQDGLVAQDVINDFLKWFISR